MTGIFAISKAGHDKGKMYLVLKEEEDYVFLSDGKTRPVENPKKKKKKHIQPVKTRIDEALSEKIKNAQTIYNEEIKLAIKIRTKTAQNEEVDNVKS